VPDAAGNTSAASTGATATTPAYVPPADTTAPSVPADLTATALVKRIDLTWTASTDDTAVAAYEISRDGTVIAVTYSPAYSDLAVAEGTSHSYTVRALDGAGNASAQTTAATSTAYPNPPPQIAYTYDLADRLTAITSVSGSSTSFGIDALGRHASQTVTGSPTQTYGYLGAGNTVVSISANWSPQRAP
jgi:YD repeat-containing protein